MVRGIGKAGTPACPSPPAGLRPSPLLPIQPRDKARRPGAWHCGHHPAPWPGGRPLCTQQGQPGAWEPRNGAGKATGSQTRGGRSVISPQGWRQLQADGPHHRPKGAGLRLGCQGDSTTAESSGPRSSGSPTLLTKQPACQSELRESAAAAPVHRREESRREREQAAPRGLQLRGHWDQRQRRHGGGTRGNPATAHSSDDWL